MAQTQKENEWLQIRSNMPLTQTHRRKRKKQTNKPGDRVLLSGSKMKHKCPKADVYVSSRHIED